MGKRQVRIFRGDIGANLENLLQKDVHVVLRSNQVLRGVITEHTAGQLSLLNHRLQPHYLEFAEIEEIVYDRETEY